MSQTASGTKEAAARTPAGKGNSKVSLIDGGGKQPLKKNTLKTQYSNLKSRRKMEENAEKRAYFTYRLTRSGASDWSAAASGTRMQTNYFLHFKIIIKKQILSSRNRFSRPARRGRKAERRGGPKREETRGQAQGPGAGGAASARPRQGTSALGSAPEGPILDGGGASNPCPRCVLSPVSIGPGTGALQRPKPPLPAV